MAIFYETESSKARTLKAKLLIFTSNLWNK